jgi:hypothetical protein
MLNGGMVIKNKLNRILQKAAVPKLGFVRGTEGNHDSISPDSYVRTEISTREHDNMKQTC